MFSFFMITYVTYEVTRGFTFVTFFLVEVLACVGTVLTDVNRLAIFDVVFTTRRRLGLLH